MYRCILADMPIYGLIALYTSDNIKFSLWSWLIWYVLSNILIHGCNNSWTAIGCMIDFLPSKNFLFLFGDCLPSFTIAIVITPSCIIVVENCSELCSSYWVLLSVHFSLAADWPSTMQIGRLISQDHMNNK